VRFSRVILSYKAYRWGLVNSAIESLGELDMNFVLVASVICWLTQTNKLNPTMSVVSASFEGLPAVDAEMMRKNLSEQKKRLESRLHEIVGPPLPAKGDFVEEKVACHWDSLMTELVSAISRCPHK
jgi:hypothetical protein